MADKTTRELAIYKEDSYSLLKKKKTKDIVTKPAESNDKPPKFIKDYYQDYYLLFGKKQNENTVTKGKENAYDPYKTTLDFLTNTLKYDGGELRQARENKEKYKDAIYSKSRQRCSYCLVNLSGAEYDILSDGRYRCPACSKSLIKTKEEIEKLFETTIENFKIYFDAFINVPIDVFVLNEKKLKRKLKKTIDSYIPDDGVILGCAVRKKVRGQNKYFLFLENGAPRISVIATIAHELTHIWQYEQEKIGKWKPSSYQGIVKGPRGIFLSNLEICEGMAVWAEIQYLYIIGEEKYANRLVKRTEERNDEYGIGFKGFEKEFHLQTKIGTIPNHPFSIKDNQDSKMSKKKKKENADEETQV